MPEKFLILGASSFYGRNFADLVESRGDIAIRHRHYGEAESCDYVVNFASKSLVAESWDQPWAWFDANVVMLSLVVNHLLKYVKLGKFIHVSTPESYGHTEGWVTENHKSWSPSTPYGVSRAAADLMLMAYHRAYQFPALITRTANIYGEGQQDFRIIPHAFACKRDGKRLALHGGGESVRCFIHVRDACEATYLIAKEGRAGETYHISTQEPHRIRDVVEMVGCEWEAAPERIGKDHAYLLDSAKLRGMGWNNTERLEDWIRENRPS